METKVKTSVTISKDLLKEVDNFAKDFRNRSEFVETALRDLVERKRQQQKPKLTREEEIAILNRIAVEQREEILENLKIQADL
ncbi:MAG TPA: type II toxin-antitoxin system CcdA family antitoxin [Pyrinomonadaceae bacterium]|nr:type II toxin-antitoxin system CcdA family antitoxin [Pyrinomonadaceae bacterium]